QNLKRTRLPWNFRWMKRRKRRAPSLSLARVLDRHFADKSPHSTAAPCSASAFTLIEMLVVIAIIGLLAALLMNLLPRASNMKIRTRVKAELAQVDMAIEHY